MCCYVFPDVFSVFGIAVYFSMEASALDAESSRVRRKKVHSSSFLAVLPHRMLAFLGSEECRTLPARQHVLSWCSEEVVCSERDSLVAPIFDSAVLSFTMSSRESHMLQSFLLIVLMLILLVICWISPSTFISMALALGAGIPLRRSIGIHFVVLPKFQEVIIHLVLQERLRKHHPTPSLPCDIIGRNTRWIFTRATSALCSSLWAMLTLHISDALSFGRETRAHWHWTWRPRKSLNTQDKSERLTAVTGHLFQGHDGQLPPALYCWPCS